MGAKAAHELAYSGGWGGHDGWAGATPDDQPGPAGRPPSHLHLGHLFAGNAASRHCQRGDQMAGDQGQCSLPEAGPPRVWNKAWHQLTILIDSDLLLLLMRKKKNTN